MRKGLIQSWMHRLAEFWGLPWESRLLLIKTVVWLGLARLVVLVLPMHRIAPYLGHPMEESPDTNEPEQRAAAERIAWAVNTMSRFTPWDSNCFARAIAAKRMLQQFKIPSTLYMGVVRKDAQELEAHAWLRSGTVMVTGAEEMRRFTVVSTFA